MSESLETILQAEERLASRISGLVLAELVKRSGRATYPGGSRIKYLRLGLSGVLPAPTVGEYAVWRSVGVLPDGPTGMELIQIAWKTSSPTTALGIRLIVNAPGPYAGIGGRSLHFPALNRLEFSQNAQVGGIVQPTLWYTQGGPLLYWADPRHIDRPLYQTLYRSSANETGLAEAYTSTLGGYTFNQLNSLSSTSSLYELVLIEWL